MGFLHDFRPSPFCAVGQNPGHASEQAEVIGFCQFIVACLLHLSIFDIQISLSSGVVTSRGDAACNFDLSRIGQFF